MAAACGRAAEGVRLTQDGGGGGKREEKEARLGEDAQMGENEVEMELGLHRRAPTIHPSMERCVWLLRYPPPQIKLMM